MVNKNSTAYKAGRLVLMTIAYIVGRRWGRKPLDKSFPQKK